MEGGLFHLRNSTGKGLFSLQHTFFDSAIKARIKEVYSAGALIRMFTVP